MKTKRIVGLFATVLVVAALAGGYWLLQRTQPANKCGICQRDIHAEARAVMEREGRREPVCCVRCALTLARQQHKPVRLVEATDYVTRRPLSPEAAYYVEGSDVILCERHEPLLNHTKQPYARVFDRCVPSLYAFARREDAEAFAATHGGAVRRLSQLLEEVEARP
jgi:hypothetical protein